MSITDPRYNELRGALLNMESIIASTPVTDTSFVSLLKIYQETRGTYLRYANEQFNKMALEMKNLADQLEQDLEVLVQNTNPGDLLDVVIGVSKAIAGIVTTGGMGNVLSSILA